MKNFLFISLMLMFIYNNLIAQNDEDSSGIDNSGLTEKKIEPLLGGNILLSSIGDLAGLGWGIQAGLK